MKFHSNLTITNMFTVRQPSRQDISPSPSARFINPNRPNSSIKMLHPTTPTKSRATTASSDGIIKRNRSRIPVRSKSRKRESEESEDNNHQKGSSSFNIKKYIPFPFMFSDYEKDKYTTGKPPLPATNCNNSNNALNSNIGTIPLPPQTPSSMKHCRETSRFGWNPIRANKGAVREDEETLKPISPLNRSYHHHPSRHADGNNKPMTAVDGGNGISSVKSLLGGISGFLKETFIGGETENSHKQATTTTTNKHAPVVNHISSPKKRNSKEFYRNLNYGYEDDFCSSGMYLVSGVGGGEAPSSDIPSQFEVYNEDGDQLRMMGVTPPKKLNSSTMASGFASTEGLRNLQKVSSDSSRRKREGNSPQVEIPNEIQDDLLRMEMLLELRKFKRALSAQLQAQERLMHMCSSDQNLQSSQLNSKVPLNKTFINSPEQGQCQSSSGRITYLQNLMDRLQEQLEAQGHSIDDNKPWENGLLGSTNFLNSSQEPHIINPPNVAVKGQVIQRGMLGGHVQQQQNANNQPSHNPAGIGGQNVQSPYDKFILGTNSLLLDGLQNFSPNIGFKIAENRANSQQQLPLPSNLTPEVSIPEMLRKPVAVTKQRSPMQITNNSFSPSAIANSLPIPVAVPGQDDDDIPSPFFPGLSGQIEMKIRNPKEIITMRQQRSHQKSLTAAKLKPGPVDPEDVEELGNLLNRLPVLSRKQKVEQFACRTVTPASPATDAESETSMVPLVSSNGTLVTPEQCTVEDRNQTTEEEEEPNLRNVDTTKMSISELVTLGRKIYKILSQLNTSATSSKMGLQSNPATPTPPTAPFSVENYSNNNNVVITPVKGQSKISPNSAKNGYYVDFGEIIQNPSFVTGPGFKTISKTFPTKEKQRLPKGQKSSSRSKLIEPAPTRWVEKRNSGSNSWINPPQPQQSFHRNSHHNQQQQQSYRRSMSSMHQGGSRPGSCQNFNNIGKRGVGIEDEKSITIPTAAAGPRNMRGNVRFNNGYYDENEGGNFETSFKHSHHQRTQRQSTPYGFQAAREYQDMRSNKNSRNANHAVGKRNFIHENIVKAKLMRKISEGRTLKPKPLPPVARKYENIQSVVASQSRSRSGERDRSTSNNRIGINGSKSNRNGNLQRNSRADYKRRASSLPVTGIEGFFRRKGSPSRYTHPYQALRLEDGGRRGDEGRRVGTASSHKSSSARSDLSDSSIGRSRTPPSRLQTYANISAAPKMNSQVQVAAAIQPSKSTGRQLQQSAANVTQGGISVASAIVAAAKTSTRVISNTSSIGNNLNAGENNKAAIQRKSRSKTKRSSVIANEFKNNSTSSIENKASGNINNANGKDANGGGTVGKAKDGEVGELKKDGTTSGSKIILRRTKGNRLLGVGGETEYYDNDTKKNSSAAVFNSPSEQELIREMVKAEMNLMVEKHVKQVLKQKKVIKSSKEEIAATPPEESLKKEESFTKKSRHIVKEKDKPSGKNTKESDGDEQMKYISSVEESDFENLTPVYTPPRVYDESLFALEKWINPEGSLSGTAYTSAKDTPATTAGEESGGEAESTGSKKGSKQTVRFNLPHQSRKITK